MTNLIVEVSKYLMILLMAIYTYANFRFFSFPDLERKRKVCARQNRAMFLLHFLAYVVMYLKTEDETLRRMLLVFYMGQVVFFLFYIYIYRFIYRNVSRLLVNNCLWVAGNESFGAQLSLTVGGISIQPSEFVKISFVFFVASMFYQSLDFKNICITTVVAALHVVILVLSKDLGSALIFFISYVIMLFIATGNWLYLIAAGVLGKGATSIAYTLFDHVRRRFTAWKNPWADIDNTGYQITQSLFAIGTGGWFGMGLCQGMPNRIPVVEKDFIFAAISEEMGAIFAICVLLICLGCFIQFMMIATQMQAMFYKIIAVGLGMEYVVQVFLTVGGVTKFIPSTGVTLPFVSYGGSSIVTTFLLFSIIQGLYIIKRNDEEEMEEMEAQEE